MSVVECEIKDPKKQLDFYKELCEVKDNKIKELENINDKLSSALESAEEKNNKIIKYIENREFKDRDFPLKDIKNLVQGKEIN